MEKEQVTIIFGATGSVGAGVCRELARAGHTVVAHYFHNQKKAQQLVDEITALGGKAEAIQADVRELNQVEELVRQVSERYKTIHTAVNLIHRDDYEPKEVCNMEWEDWQCHLEAMKVHFNICKALCPVMKRQQYGRIIYISGGLAYRFYKGCAAYSAAKAGLNAFSKTLAAEVGKDHITVNIVAPGKVVQTDTAGTDRFQEDQVSKCPLGRFTTPADIAGAIEYFASPTAENVTGQTIYVSGGEIMPMP